MFERLKRVVRKRARLFVRIAPYLSGRSSAAILVDELYLGILGNLGDGNARKVTAKALKAGQITVLEIVQRLVSLSEPRSEAAQGLIESDAREIYRGILQRAPTEQELRRTSRALRSGSPLSLVIQHVQSSTEARSRYFTHALEDGGFADLILAEARRRGER